jgi:hypothetical protein
MTHPADELESAVDAIRVLGTGQDLSRWIARIERRLSEKSRRQASSILDGEGVTDDLLDGALVIKALAGQIDVIVHAVGILRSLPHILEPGERIETLSLGAGSSASDHDLVTDRRIAEFKFTRWRGRDAARQSNLFVDLFNLVVADTTKRRYLYVVGMGAPLRFLEGRRSMRSVLSKHAFVASRFRDLSGDAYLTVGDYYASISDRVEIVDLVELIPGLSEADNRLRPGGGMTSDHS